MANEITITTDFALSKGGLEKSFVKRRAQFDQAGVGAFDSVQDIGTAEEEITLVDITTPGWAMFLNLDATNYVQWGFSTGVYGGRMEAGEHAGPFRLDPGASLFLKANTAACRVVVLVLED